MTPIQPNEVTKTEKVKSQHVFFYFVVVVEKFSLSFLFFFSGIPE